MSLGQRIKQRREILKLTQKQLAESLKVTPQHVSVIEQDKRTPSIVSLAKIAEELGVSIDYLVTGKEGIVTGVIPAIKGDKTLNVEVKKALITLIQSIVNSNK
jgi:transcriptional regulator with XRE-family HTH domain